MTNEKQGAGRMLKTAAGFVLVGIAVAAVAIGIVRESRSTDEAAAQIPGASIELGVVTVYYFHGDTRCKTCLAIESETTRVVRERFEPELDAGILRFEIVNFDTPGDAHFRDDYDLAFGTVLVQGVGETWENLADVWRLIHDDPAAFEEYLAEHIRPMLDAAG